MQAVILAAGRGVRMGSLTESIPKALLPIAGKTLLEQKFDILPEGVDEVIIVVGYLGSYIQKKFGGTYKDRHVLYVEQEKIHGTAAALWEAKDILKDRFLVMMCDDLYSREDIDRCALVKDWALVVQETEGKEAGRVLLDEDHRVIDVIENGGTDMKSLVSTNLFLLDTRIFNSEMVLKALGSEEYGLPQTAIAAARDQGIMFEAIRTNNWIQITSPEDLKKAEAILTMQNVK